jgi:hypothetical protein
MNVTYVHAQVWGERNGIHSGKLTYLEFAERQNKFVDWNELADIIVFKLSCRYLTLITVQNPSGGASGYMEMTQHSLQKMNVPTCASLAKLEPSYPVNCSPSTLPRKYATWETWPPTKI